MLNQKSNGKYYISGGYQPVCTPCIVDMTHFRTLESNNNIQMGINPVEKGAWGKMAKLFGAPKQVKIFNTAAEPHIK